MVHWPAKSRAVSPDRPQNRSVLSPIHCRNRETRRKIQCDQRILLSSARTSVILNGQGVESNTSGFSEPRSRNAYAGQGRRPDRTSASRGAAGCNPQEIMRPKGSAHPLETGKLLSDGRRSDCQIPPSAQQQNPNCKGHVLSLVGPGSPELFGQGHCSARVSRPCIYRKVRPQAKEVLIAASVTVQADSSTSAAQTQKENMNADTRVNHLRGRTG